MLFIVFHSFLRSGLKLSRNSLASSSFLSNTIIWCWVLRLPKAQCCLVCTSNPIMRQCPLHWLTSFRQKLECLLKRNLFTLKSNMNLSGIPETPDVGQRPYPYCYQLYTGVDRTRGTRISCLYSQSRGYFHNSKGIHNLLCFSTFTTVEKFAVTKLHDSRFILCKK